MSKATVGIISFIFFAVAGALWTWIVYFSAPRASPEDLERLWIGTTQEAIFFRGVSDSVLTSMMVQQSGTSDQAADPKQSAGTLDEKALLARFREEVFNRLPAAIVADALSVIDSREWTDFYSAMAPSTETPALSAQAQSLGLERAEQLLVEGPLLQDTESIITAVLERNRSKDPVTFAGRIMSKRQPELRQQLAAVAPRLAVMPEPVFKSGIRLLSDRRYLTVVMILRRYRARLISDSVAPIYSAM